MFWIYILFIFAALAVLGGAHYFFYFSVVHFFSNLTALAKNWLIADLIILPISFFVSILLVRKFEDILSRFYYFLSGAWLGFLANFILGSLLIWLLIAVFRITGLNFNRTLVASILFFLSVCFSIYGVYNAFHPQIKNIQVTIPNLPSVWKGKTICPNFRCPPGRHLPGRLYGANNCKN